MSDVIKSKIDLSEKESGAFDFYTRALEEAEKKFYGIFISHSSHDNDDYLYPLRNEMLKKDLHPLCDRDFLSGGEDYQVKIESMLNCYAAVIIVTENSLGSNWVNYEMGILAGRDIPIYLWDPKNLLSQSDGKFHDYSNLHFEKYLPAHVTLESLIATLERTSAYTDMFCEENAFLNTESFTQRMNERVETIIATLESDIFDEYYADFAECKIGTLVPNFGMFYDGHGDGEHCFVKMGAQINGGVCPVSNKHCALHPTRVLSEANKECVLLNHVLYNGRLIRRGECDRRGKEARVGSIVFNMPLHRYYGTEFKFIIDVPNNRTYDILMSILQNAGMNPSGPACMVGGRIYLSLPARKSQGLFRLVHQFENNFLCPYAARKK